MIGKLTGTLSERNPPQVVIDCHGVGYEVDVPDGFDYLLATRDQLRPISFFTELGIKRVGHGVRGNLQGDRFLEICPTSNVVTGQFKTFADHPIDRLYRAGRKVTVNTDGTLFTCTTLSREYQLLAENFSWDVEDYLAVNLTALDAFAIPETLKAKLKRQLIKGYAAKRR